MDKDMKILIVDDEENARIGLSKLLSQEGYQVSAVGNGNEALDFLGKEQVSLVITDINMPDINGLEVVRFVKQSENFKHIPVIIVTTEGRDVDKERGLRLGADKYLVKPFQPAQLQQFVQELLG